MAAYRRNANSKTPRLVRPAKERNFRLPSRSESGLSSSGSPNTLRREEKRRKLKAMSGVLIVLAVGACGLALVSIAHGLPWWKVPAAGAGVLIALVLVVTASTWIYDWWMKN